MLDIGIFPRAQSGEPDVIDALKTAFGAAED
jgi:hypothetical protein